VEQAEEEILTADQVAEKLNGRKRGEIPIGCSYVTAFIDVHDSLLFWMVAAWEQDFTGYVVDYGTYPKQGRRYFTLRDAKPTMQAKAPHGAGKEAAILAGLGVVIDQIAGHTWTRDDGAAMKVGRCLIDAGYVPDLVFQAIRLSPHVGVVMPSRGIGIGARNKPLSEYRRKRGEQYGHHWRIPSVRGRRELRTLNSDVNYWKTFVQRRLLVPLGDPACLSLYGQRDRRHQLLAEHLTAEHAVRTEGYGRQVDEWRICPGITENHPS